MFLKSYFLVGFVLVLPTVVFADPSTKGHGHTTPHGGMVQKVGGMHIEFLVEKNGEPKLYMYDKAMKPLTRANFPVRLTLQGDDGTEHTRDLKPSGNEKGGAMFKGDPIKSLTDWDRAVISLKVKDQWTHVKFSHH